MSVLFTDPNVARLNGSQDRQVDLRADVPRSESLVVWGEPTILCSDLIYYASDGSPGHRRELYMAPEPGLHLLEVPAVHWLELVSCADEPTHLWIAPLPEPEEGDGGAECRKLDTEPVVIELPVIGGTTPRFRFATPSTPTVPNRDQWRPAEAARFQPSTLASAD